MTILATFLVSFISWSTGALVQPAGDAYTLQPTQTVTQPAASIDQLQAQPDGELCYVQCTVISQGA